MTHLRQFADHVLGGRLDAFVAEHRAQGIGWDRIARELWDCTGHKINLSGQTLREWYQQKKSTELERRGISAGQGSLL